MLKKRLITALWGIPLVIATIWFAKPISWFTVFAAIWGLLAILEFYRITSVSRVLSLTVFGTIWCLLFIVCPHWNYNSSLMILLTSTVVFSLTLRVVVGADKLSLATWVWSVIGVFYVGLLLSILVMLRINAGREWLYLVVFCTFGSDTMAYFIGRAIGRHKMAPRISPGKTWEGAIAGIFGGMIVSLLFTLSTPVQVSMGYGEAIGLGLLISVAGQIGDLAESLLKRRMGVKESGTLMPGHGGLLDRMDSIVFAGLAIYIYYVVAVA